MLKIFDKEVQKYLKETGVTDEEINKIKERELHKAVLERLEKVVELFKAKKYNKVKKMMALPNEYDAYNHCIDFKYLVGSSTTDLFVFDLADVIQLLEDTSNAL